MRARALAAAAAATFLLVGGWLIRAALREEEPTQRRTVASPALRTYARAGVAVRYPKTWRVSLQQDSHVTNPVLRFELTRWDGATVVRLREWLPPLLDRTSLAGTPQRPKQFDLDAFARLEGEGPRARGSQFRDSGRAFFLVIRLAPRGQRTARGEVAAILGSIRAAPRKAPLRIRRTLASHSFGLPWRGTLAGGVQLPAQGPTFFTWDPVRRRSPNRGWRRFGTERLVRTVLTVVAEYHAAHPDAPRVGIGDLSRPNGGDFGPRYGRPGHVSHQNGVDVDIYYPRLDRRERAPESPRQIDSSLAQELVDRFVRAGASRVFVGPLTGLSGDPGVVQALPRHDNHLHVRLP